MRKVLCIIIILALVSMLSAKISGNLWSGLRFDSNICSLSDYDITRFENWEKDFLIETIDDGIFRLGGSINYSKKSGEFKLYAGASFWSSMYYENFDKSYFGFSSYFKIRRGGTNIKISLGGTPKYIIRAYIDDDTDSTKWSGYKSLNGSIEISQRIIPYIYIRGQYKRTMSIYNDYFPEYDSNRDEFEIGILRNGTTSFEAGYCFRISDARGYDNEGETKESSDESDISYEQDMLFIEVGQDFKLLGKRCEAGLYADYARRFYQSTKSYLIDPLHVSRSESMWQANPSVKIGLTEKNWVKFETSFRFRRAESELNPDIPKLRDYNRFLTTLIFGWSF